ncbi:MAG: hypothetical protein RL120_17505, partial [Gammaproteobacteria bacterium]
GEDDNKEATRKKLEDGLDSLVPGHKEALAVVCRLYDIDLGVNIDKERFLLKLANVVRDILNAASQQAPVVICLQDLHWADASTMLLTRELLSNPGGAVVFIVNFRPGLTFDEDNIHVINLDVLSNDQSRELLESLLGGPAPALLYEFIQDRAEGNPFFTEEIVQSMIETGALAREGETWKLVDQNKLADIPATVQGVLAARIGRLADDRRRLLREAAVIGREFLYELVKQISQIECDVNSELEGLAALDLIREKSKSEFLEYMFKHALVQEVAYEGLLKKERQQLHKKVGQAIETLLKHRAGDMVETLAYHYQLAGDVDKAVFYSIAAGKRAFDHNAITEAENIYEAAYDLLMETERTEAQNRLLVELVVQWCSCLIDDMKIVKAAQLLDKHWDTAEQLNDPELMVLYRSQRGFPYFGNIEFEKSLSLGNQTITMARTIKNREAEAKALAINPFPLISLGRLPEALESARLAVSIVEKTDDPGYFHHYALCLAQLWYGSWNELDEEILWMEAQVESGFARFESYAKLFRSWESYFFIDMESALELSKSAL